MFKPHRLSLLVAAAVLAGCQAVNTTSGGADASCWIDFSAS